MKRYGLSWLTAALVGALAVVPLAAHHSFDAEYDANNTANLEGVVTKVEWTNPHAHIFMNVSGANGEVRTFSIELGPPYALVRGGWQRDTVEIGDSITMENVALARNGSDHAGATRESALILADGRRMVLR